jgi:LacI family transcriptional regulator
VLFSSNNHKTSITACHCVYAQLFVYLMRNPLGSTRANLIVVALPLLSEGEIELVQGVRKSLLSLGEDYEVLLLSGGYEASLRKLADQGELAGTIGEFMSPVWLKSLIDQGIPVVQLGQHAGDKIPWVSADLKVISKESSRTFLENGVKSCAYLGASGPADSVRLGEAFIESCNLLGHTVAVCCEFSAPTLKAFLNSLPLPAGLLCATDRLAHLAAHSARDIGLRIPQDLAVIGIGNSRMESLQAGISLSSFDLSLGEIGLKAGSIMADLIKGKSVSANLSVQITPKFHERESSLRSTSGVTRALAYLRSNPGSSMSAGELAHLAGMSRRSFEMAMLAECEKSPGALLQELRQKRAKELLKTSEFTIAAVGRECGYKEASVFSTAFRRWTGMSPREYRKADL